MEALFNYVDKFSKEILFIQIGFLLIIFAVFIWVWLYNRRRYQHLKHQIPASVVKNYLDSIIQNSTALKSSLFRGGGLDVDANSVPSVMSFKDIAQGVSSAALASGSESEEINAKNAEIMRLRSELEVKNNVVRDLEKEMTGLKGEVRARGERITELEKLLSEARNSQGTEVQDEEVLAELSEIKTERDELKNRLAEYAIIEDDLANLKRLQQENEQLKEALGAGNDSADINEEDFEEVIEASSEADEIFESEGPSSDLGIDEDELQAMEDALDSSEEESLVSQESEPAQSPVDEEEEQEQAQVVEAQAQTEEEEDKNDSEKSPEDLLSEFEKMLG